MYFLDVRTYVDYNKIFRCCTFNVEILRELIQIIHLIDYASILITFSWLRFISDVRPFKIIVFFPIVWCVGCNWDLSLRVRQFRKADRTLPVTGNSFSFTLNFWRPYGVPMYTYMYFICRWSTICYQLLISHSTNYGLPNAL